VLPVNTQLLKLIKESRLLLSKVSIDIKSFQAVKRRQLFVVFAHVAGIEIMDLEKGIKAYNKGVG
jgi:hypothetical protein